MCAPGWIRSVLIRRSIAAALIVCAGVVTVVDRREPATSTALVASRDLRPGDVLSSADVKSVPVPDHLRPAEQLSAGDLVGRHVTGVVDSGEIVTRHRLLDSRLPAALTGRSDARLVTVAPSDDTLATFVRAGDLVDLLSEDSRVLARSAVVAVTPEHDRRTSAETSAVLVAMPEGDAHRVAAAGLRDRITFVLH